MTFAAAKKITAPLLACASLSACASVTAPVTTTFVNNGLPSGQALMASQLEQRCVRLDSGRHEFVYDAHTNGLFKGWEFTAFVNDVDRRNTDTRFLDVYGESPDGSDKYHAHLEKKRFDIVPGVIFPMDERRNTAAMSPISMAAAAIQVGIKAIREDSNLYYLRRCTARDSPSF